MRGFLPVMLAAVAALGLSPQAAVAQPAEPIPSYAQPPATLPSYARPAETIRGRITLVRGDYIEVQDERGYVDRVQLHHGTVINPTGLTLAPGFDVTISGRTTGSVFTADVIDTPYRTYGAPYPYYYPYPYPYPYPPYVGPGYVFGPSFYFGLGFGHYWR